LTRGGHGVAGDTLGWVRKHLLQLIGPILLALILWQLDVARLGAIMAGVRWPYLAATLLLYPPMVALKVWRWQILLERQGLSYGVWRANLVYHAALFLGYATPGRLGELAKSVYVRRDFGVSLGQGFSSVVVDRLLDLYVVLMTVGVGLTAFTLSRGLTGIALILVLAVTIAPFLLLNRRLGLWAVRNLTRLPPVAKYGERIGGSLESFYQELAGLIDIRLMGPLALTLVSYVVFYGQCYLLAQGLGMEISYGYIAFSIAVANLLSLVPITISGLGTREGVLVLLLGMRGIEPEVAVSYSLLFFLCFNVWGALIGALAWYLEPVELKQPQA